MSNLGSQALTAQQQPAIHDDAPVNACAVGDVDQILCPLAGTESLFGQSGQIGVVAQIGGEAELLLDKGPQRHQAPAGESGSLDDHALPWIQGTSTGNSDSLSLLQMLVDCLADGFLDALDHWPSPSSARVGRATRRMMIPPGRSARLVSRCHRYPH